MMATPQWLRDAAIAQLQQDDLRIFTERANQGAEDIELIGFIWDSTEGYEEEL